MLATPSSLLMAQLGADRLLEVCGENPTLACEKVLEWTGSDGWAGVADFFLGRPFRILLVLVAASMASRLAKRAITRAVRRATDPAATGPLARAGLTTRKRVEPQGDEAPDQRALQRSEAIGSVARSASSAVIWGIAVFTIFGEIGVSLGPLLASAGIAGVALGFGAQNMVKDLLSGLFMLAEDQYGVGDVVDVGEAEGTVEGISLRTTRVRDIEGTLWHVPNGEIRRVGNHTQDWARVVLDVGVGYATDLDRAATVIKEVASGMRSDEAWSPSVAGDPEIWGVETLGDSSVAIRLVVRTRPGDQWKVRRELNRRLKDRLDDEDIEIPFPQQTVWLRTDATGTSTPVIATSGAPNQS